MFWRELVPILISLGLLLLTILHSEGWGLLSLLWGIASCIWAAYYGSPLYFDDEKETGGFSHWLEELSYSPDYYNRGRIISAVAGIVALAYPAFLIWRYSR